MPNLFHLFVISCLAGFVSFTHGQAEWTLRGSLSRGVHLLSVIWTGSQFVTVGGGGTILTSPDGISWSRKESGTGNWLNSVAGSGKILVAVGGAGTLLTSPDGETWTKRETNTGHPLNSVTWTGAQFLVTGDSGKVLTSSDGFSWTWQDSDFQGNEKLGRVIWAGEQFVAAGLYGDFPNDRSNILTSPDGIVWTFRKTSYTIVSLAWTGSKLFAMDRYGNVSSSTDGIQWEHLSYINEGGSVYACLLWTRGELLAVGNRVQTSSDGIRWEAKSERFPTELYSVVSTGTQLVAVGQDGTIMTSPQTVGIACGSGHAKRGRTARLRQHRFGILVSSPEGFYGLNGRTD